MSSSPVEVLNAWRMTRIGFLLKACGPKSCRPLSWDWGQSDVTSVSSVLPSTRVTGPCARPLTDAVGASSNTRSYTLCVNAGQTSSISLFSRCFPGCIRLLQVAVTKSILWWNFKVKFYQMENTLQKNTKSLYNTYHRIVRHLWTRKITENCCIKKNHRKFAEL